MSLLDEREAAGRIAAAQNAALAQWPKIEAATIAAARSLDRALRARGDGWRVVWHTESHCMRMPHDMVFGERHRLRFNYQRGSRPNHFIDVALVASNGSDPVTFVIRHDKRLLVELPVRDSFQMDVIESLLARAIDEIEHAA